MSTGILESEGKSLGLSFLHLDIVYYEEGPSLARQRESLE